MSFDKKNENQIQALGYELISEFGDELYKILDKRLTPKFGNDWFLKTLKFKEGGRRPSSPKDVHTIVHQVLTEKNNDWRGAISAEFKLSDYGKYAYRYLENILDSRNKWMHPDDVFSKDHLLHLVKSIHKIFGNRDHPLGDKCEEMLELLRIGEPFNLAMYSRAFGEDYLLALRQNELLRDELMKFRDLTLHPPFITDFPEEELQNASRERLFEIVAQINNERVITEQSRQFFIHHGARESIKGILFKNGYQIMILVNNFLQDNFFADPRVEVRLDGIVGEFTEPLEINHFRDLLQAYLSEVADQIRRIIVLSKEAGSDKCTCKVCEVFGPVGYEWFVGYDPLVHPSMNELFDSWGFLDDFVGNNLLKLVWGEVVRMQVQNNFSDSEMGYWYEDYPGLTKEEVEEVQELKERARS